jgi:hypothetical protein
MNPEDVPSELVEKAARAMQGVVWAQFWRDRYARLILAAVLPEIQAQALESAAADDEHGWALRTWLNARAARLRSEAPDA